MNDGPEEASRLCEERLRQVEERLRLMEESVKDYAILYTDTEGVVTFWSKGAGRVFGYAEAEILGRPAAVLFTPEDREAGVPRRELSQAETTGHGEDVRWHLRKDGTLVFLNGVVTPLRDGEGGLRGFAKVARDVTERRRAEDKLREGEERRRAILESITDAFFALDRDWRFTYVNRQAEALLNRGRNDLLGKCLWEEYPGTVGNDIERRYRRAMEGGVAAEFDEFYPPHDRWYENRLYPSPAGLSVYFRDITERRRQEELLREGDERLRLATEATGLGTWDFDPQTGVVVTSDSGKAAFGLSHGEELTYEKFLAAVPPEDRERVHRANQEALAGAGGGRYAIEYQAVGRVDGIARWVEARGQAYFDRGGRAVRFLGTLLDITGRKQAEEQIRREREWLSVTLSSIGDAVIATDGEGRVVFMNPVAGALTGWAQGEATGKPLEEVFVMLNEQTRRPADSPVVRVIREGDIVGVANHTILISRDGTETDIEDSAAPIKDASGRIFGVVMVFQDVTERRRHQSELRASEEKYRTILESITDAFYAFDRQWRFSYVNSKAETLLGKSREELLGGDVWEIYSDAIGSDFYTAFHRAMDERVVVSFEAFYPPHDRWYELHAYPSEDGISVYFRDIGERKRHEQELRVSEEQRRLALDSAEMGAWRIDSATVVLTTDERFRTIFRGHPGPFTLDEAFAAIHPDDRERVRAKVAAAMRPDDPAPYAEEYRVVHPDGTVRWVFAKGRANFEGSESGLRLISFDGTLGDITDRKRVEEQVRVARDEAENANRAKDHFLAVLSHELRTPLNPILLAASSMLERTPDPEEVRPTLEMIRENVKLQARLIDDLLDVMRIVQGKMPLHWGVSNCHALIEQSIEICRSEFQGKSQEIVLDLSAERHHVNADSARLHQVLWNLVRNAVKFTPEGGKVTVRTRNEVVGEQHIVIEVADTGIGIEPDVLPTIWDPFQQGETTITRRFGGLGLGLAICKGVVDAHGGTLTAESEGSDRGTTFRVLLKTMAEPATEAEVGSGEVRSLPPLNRLNILLVEDEVATLRLMARLLKGLGHRVTAAGTVADAWDAFQADGFDMIVSDIGLPDGTGLDLMRKVKAVRQVPAIALTGYGMDEDVRRSREAGFATHMTKPIDFTKLEAMIRQVAH